MARSPYLRRAALALLILGAALAGHGAWIPVKALVAQQLLQRAWAKTLNEGGTHRPWPWADHWPIARLLAPRQGIDLIVLEGDSGAVLAFAPGRSSASGKPGTGSTVLISGHRDTHFRFLQDLAPGDLLYLETAKGPQSYRVTGTTVHDARTDKIAIREDIEELILSTCYPFDAPIAGGPLRYLVRAEGLANTPPSLVRTRSVNRPSNAALTLPRFLRSLGAAVAHLQEDLQHQYRLSHALGQPTHVHPPQRSPTL